MAKKKKETDVEKQDPGRDEPPPREGPQGPDQAAARPSFKLYKRLLKLLAAAGDEDTTMGLSHVLMERWGSRLRLTCCDGYVLARAQIVCDASLLGPTDRELLPRPLADALAKAPVGREEMIDIAILPRQISALLPSGMTMESPTRVDLPFPDADVLAPPPTDAIRVEINPSYLAMAMKAIVSAADRCEKITLHVVPGKHAIRLTASDDTVEAMAIVMALGVTLCQPPGRKPDADLPETDDPQPQDEEDDHEEE